MGIILVAAGAGERLGRGMPKARVPVAGRTILERSLNGLLAAAVAHQVVVVLPADDTDLAAICSRFASAAADVGILLHAVSGGATRNASVRAGLDALEPAVELVLVHDAARALTPPDVFRRVVDALLEGAEAVIPAVPVTDTVKTIEHASTAFEQIAPEVVVGTPERATLRAVQTPQGFTVETLRAAHAGADTLPDAQAVAITDDAMLAETLGIPVFVVQGSAESLKITTSLDLLVAEALLGQGR